MEWISVKDRLPEHLDRVLVSMDTDGHIMMAGFQIPIGGAPEFIVYFADGRKRPEGREITHWMPLPEPPPNKY